ncbi:MAG: LUD domain-containing protein [Candidatus Aminicenantales bacterium]
MSRKKKKIKEALKNKNLEQALRHAALNHYQHYKQAIHDIPWEEYKKKARAIKEECTARLPELILKFSQEAKKAGAKVYLASTAESALNLIEKILGEKKAKFIVKSKSMVSEEIRLNDFLEKKGYQVVETDLGEWIVQLAGERPSHITGPALHKTKEEIAELLSRKLKSNIAPQAKEIVRAAREKMREYFFKAEAGISGANLAVAESGTLMIISNEGNARLTTTLPPLHIALITTEKFVETLEQAAVIAKTLVTASSGHKLTAYVSFITGPSRTTDVEKELVIGVHGPEELHVIILDNGRLKLAQDEKLKEILYCLKCGGCMLVCPVFQAVGGHVFGGPVYPGGIGLLMTTMTEALKKVAPLFDFCADCKKCEVFCPVGIPTAELILSLKSRKGPDAKEVGISRLFTRKEISEMAVKIMHRVQKYWEKEGYLKNIPLKWAKDKSLPALRLGERSLNREKKGKVKDRGKIYLFQGCLTKFFFPEIRESVVKTLTLHGYDVVCPQDQACCGAPSLHLGDMKGVRNLALENLASFESENPDIIITVCPTGKEMLKIKYPEIERKHERWKDKIFDFTEFMLVKGLLSGQKKKRGEIFYHYPCHYNELKIIEGPKKLIESLGYSVKEEEEPQTCCGFCGIFSFKNPEISLRIWERKKESILRSKASFISTDCPGCLFQLRAHLRKEDHPYRIVHTAELCSDAMNTSPEP